MQHRLRTGRRRHRGQGTGLVLGDRMVVVALRLSQPLQEGPERRRRRRSAVAVVVIARGVVVLFKARAVAVLLSTKAIQVVFIARGFGAGAYDEKCIQVWVGQLMRGSKTRPTKCWFSQCCARVKVREGRLRLRLRLVRWDERPSDELEPIVRGSRVGLEGSGLEPPGADDRVDMLVVASRLVLEAKSKIKPWRNEREPQSSRASQMA